MTAMSQAYHARVFTLSCIPIAGTLFSAVEIPTYLLELVGDTAYVGFSELNAFYYSAKGDTWQAREAVLASRETCEEMGKKAFILGSHIVNLATLGCFNLIRSFSTEMDDLAKFVVDHCSD